MLLDEQIILGIIFVIVSGLLGDYVYGIIDDVGFMEGLIWFYYNLLIKFIKILVL